MICRRFGQALGVIRPLARWVVRAAAYKACATRSLFPPPAANTPCPSPSLIPLSTLPPIFFPSLPFVFAVREPERMRSHDPTLPSITFVLSQAQPAASRSGSKRWNRFGVRRSKSSPSFAPHPPRYPPRLDSEFLTVNPSFLFLFLFLLPHSLPPPPITTSVPFRISENCKRGFNPRYQRARLFISFRTHARMADSLAN